MNQMGFRNKVVISQLTQIAFKVYCRGYARWTGRNPLKVIPAAEYDETSKKVQEEDKIPIEEVVKIKWRHKFDELTQGQEVTEIERERKPKKQKSTTKRPAITDMLDTTIDKDGNLIYTKMKNNDTRTGLLLTDAKSKKAMAQKNLILLEGKRLINDALLAGCKLKCLIFSSKSDVEFVKDNLPKVGAKIYKMPYKEMQVWSDLTTCPGIMGLFTRPNTENYVCPQSIPLTIYCDNVKEPGNLGAILRVAASVGCRKVLLSVGCTDLWDPKVTRSSAGSHFRVQIATKQSLQNLRDELCDPTIKRTLMLADNNLLNSSQSSESTGLSELINQIPIVPYYSMDVKNMTQNCREIVLVIGGETHGLSADVYALAKEFEGVRLNIPLSNNVDSLNTGTALGVIVFDFYRQIMTGGTNDS